VPTDVNKGNVLAISLNLIVGYDTYNTQLHTFTEHTYTLSIMLTITIFTTPKHSSLLVTLLRGFWFDSGKREKIYGCFHYIAHTKQSNNYVLSFYPKNEYLSRDTYESTLSSLLTPKKVVRLITFSDYRGHTNPLFNNLKILKINDLVKFQTCMFMHDYYHNNLPDVFKMFFTHVSTRHRYNTRFSGKENYCFPAVKTNYGKFNVRFAGAALWNSLEENLKKEKKVIFKKKLFSIYIDHYISE